MCVVAWPACTNVNKFFPPRLPGREVSEDSSHPRFTREGSFGGLGPNRHTHSIGVTSPGLPGRRKNEDRSPLRSQVSSTSPLYIRTTNTQYLPIAKVELEGPSPSIDYLRELIDETKVPVGYSAGRSSPASRLTVRTLGQHTTRRCPGQCGWHGRHVDEIADAGAKWWRCGGPIKHQPL